MQSLQSRIIVIDDNPKIHQDFIKILRVDAVKETDKRINNLDEQIFGPPAVSSAGLLNYDIDTALQGQEGVERISKALKMGFRYMIAFVDVRMPPGWDGIETIKHLWEVDPDVQVVICTAYSDYSWEETVNMLGLSDNLLILKKPFDTTVVRQLASTLTKKWLLTQESRKQYTFLEESIKKRTKDFQLIKATIESSEGGIMVVSKAGDVLDFNENFKAMWDIPAEILSAKQATMVFQYIDYLVEKPEKFLEKMNELMESAEQVSFSTIELKSGKIFEFHFQPQKLNNQIVGTVWSFHDVTKRIETENKLSFQATHDALTKLPNRTLLYDRVKQAIVGAQRYDNKVALLFVHLEGLQEVNDTLSHAAGDALLKAIAVRLSEHMRGEDTLSRFGGCDFVFLAHKVHQESDVGVIAKKVLTKFDAPFEIEDKAVAVTAKIGISLYPDDNDTFPELLRSATLAMNEAKNYKENHYQFYNKTMEKDEGD